MMVGALAQPALARELRLFDIKAGTLSDALVALGVQGSVSVGLSNGAVLHRPVPAVHGRLTVDAALRRLLAGSGLHAVRIDERSYTIAADRPKSSLPQPAEPIAIVPEQADIVVTASKRDILLRDFPGTIAMLDATAAGLNGNARSGTQAIIDSIAGLSSTHLGPGRNKLIIRGVADSSFTGPTQAIVGQYLGDVRLSYNAPDPNLNLYDIASVEVLEGPQGTLYGAGSLGGIVRLIANAPDLSATAGSIALGVTLVEGGGPSNDQAAMINLPLRKGRIGLRGVAYRSVEGGYIHDIRRGLRHINRSDTEGGRLALRAELGDGWRVDLGATSQDIQNRDGQYAERGLPRYTRASAIAQPFDNDYFLGQFTVSRTWDRLTLLSATGIVHHNVDERFDATAQGQVIPQVFHQESRILLFSNENRLSRQRADGTGWLIGTSFIANQERLIRDLGDAAAPARIAGVRNSVRQVAVYGELGIGIGRHLVVTAGGRLAHSRLSGELLDAGKGSSEPNRSEIEVLPSIALNWRPTARLTAYVRYQEGFRPGGLSVSAAATGVVSQRLHGDGISTLEGGARLGQPSDRFSASISASFSYWKHIQADLVNDAGMPFTANIGNGRIRGFEANARWAPLAGLSVEGGLFLNDSELTKPSSGFVDALAELPNVSRIGARASIVHTRDLGDGLSLLLRGSVRYFGHSQLGVGSQLNIGQGNYADTALGLRVGTDRIGGSFDVTNLLNAARNRFSLGNPFGVMNRQQITPQAPRTIRIGIDAHF